jgi:hypothetical protein
VLRAYLSAQVPIVELSSQRVLGELMQLIRVGLDHKTNKALIALKPQKAFPKESTSTVFGADQHMLPLYVGLQVRAAAISCYGAVYSAVGESLLTSSHLSNIKPAMLKCVCLSHP